jgi:hypothetical protein
MAGPASLALGGHYENLLRYQSGGFSLTTC